MSRFGLATGNLSTGLGLRIQGRDDEPNAWGGVNAQNDRE